MHDAEQQDDIDEPQRDEPLTIGEAARVLGISTADVYHLVVRRGTLECQKTRKGWRFSVSTLERYRRAHMTATLSC